MRWSVDASQESRQQIRQWGKTRGPAVHNVRCRQSDPRPLGNVTSPAAQVGSPRRRQSDSTFEFVCVYRFHPEKLCVAMSQAVCWLYMLNVGPAFFCCYDLGTLSKDSFEKSERVTPKRGRTMEI